MKEYDFEDLIEELRRLNDDNPQVAKKEANRTIKRIKIEIKKSNSILKDVELDKLGLCIIAILIGLVGFFNVTSLIGYLFGLAFFLAGMMVGLTQKGFGLIFLFSHGVTGLCIMEGSLIYDLFSSPLMQDSPTNIYIYLAVVLVLFLSAIIIAILHNLSDSLKEKEFFKLVPFCLCFIGFFLSGLLIHIFDFVYTFRF